MALGWKRRKRRGALKPGEAPGTITIDPEAPKPFLRVIAYDGERLEEVGISDVSEIAGFRGSFPVTWVNVDGLGDAETIAAIGEEFGLHRLALEDVANVRQRPKVEHYEEHAYLVARMASLDGHIETEQLSLFLGEGFVLTFQERQGDCFEPVRARIRKGKGRIRTAGPDYLAYALLDAVVDRYFPILESYGDRLEEMEELIHENPPPNMISRVNAAKRDLLMMRRVVWPLREALSSLVREPTPLIAEETRVYLRDCYDHAIQVMDLLETFREIASGLVDAYLSMLSHRMNEVMKVLTIIATIFIPLTFIAGIYGMNFAFIPELGLKWGYFACLGLMVIVTFAMVVYFRRKGWLGGGGPRTEPPKE
jgi:magnesium transporter